jgi:hypothetical protein
LLVGLFKVGSSALSATILPYNALPALALFPVVRIKKTANELPVGFFYWQIFGHVQTSPLRGHLALLKRIIANFLVGFPIEACAAPLPEWEIIEIDPALLGQYAFLIMPEIALSVGLLISPRLVRVIRPAILAASSARKDTR